MKDIYIAFGLLADLRATVVFEWFHIPNTIDEFYPLVDDHACGTC